MAAKAKATGKTDVPNLQESVVEVHVHGGTKRKAELPPRHGKGKDVKKVRAALLETGSASGAGSASGEKGPNSGLIELPEISMRKDISITLLDTIVNSIDGMDVDHIVRTMVEFGSKALVPAVWRVRCLDSEEQLAPTVGHKTNTFSTRFSLKMVSTRSKVGVNKQADAGPFGPPDITPDMATILDGQAKMQQELVDLKKRSADEMEALRQENSRLRRKIEADPNQKGKAKETSEAARSPTFQPTEEENEYNPTPHSFTTIQQTSIPFTHPPHFPSTQPGLTAPPTPAATLPTTQIPYNIPTTLHTTHVPPYNPQYLPTTHIPPHNLTCSFPAMINHPIPPHLLPPHQPRRRHPFTDFIANTPLPAQWEPFTLDRYTSETDHDEHLKVYITHVALYTIKSSFLHQCRLYCNGNGFKIVQKGFIKSSSKLQEAYHLGFTCQQQEQQ